MPDISDYKVNDEIKDEEVMLIGADGEQLGVMPGREAQMVAFNQDFDLVKIAPTANPPVCKLMDYSKYRYEQEKKRQAERKNQHRMELKEVRLSPNIEEHDLNVRIRRAEKFLKDGDKVKVTIRFRYQRELERTDHAKKMMEQFAEAVSEVGQIDVRPKMEHRNMIMFLVPKSS